MRHNDIGSFKRRESRMDENKPLDIKKSILLLMDYQNGIVGSIPIADKIINRMTLLLKQCRDKGLPVGYVRVALNKEEFKEVSANNKTFHQLIENRFLDTAEDTQIDQRVKPQLKDIIVRKRRVGAFSTTDLDERLAERGIDTIILAGFSTSGVVLSTIRDAADKDYRIYVLEDACADSDPEVHRLLINKIFPRQASVIKIADLPGLLGS